MICLGVLEVLPTPADIVTVDVSQLFYHIVWPHSCSPADLIASIQSCLGHYADGTEKIIVFDKYQYVSAKDDERMQQAGEVISTMSSPLPVLCPKGMQSWVLSVLEKMQRWKLDGGAFGHDEADITMISYVLEAAYDGKGVISVLSEDTDVFVLLVNWVYREELQCKVQMERWDTTVQDINATCTELRSKYLQLLGMHALSGVIQRHIHMAKTRSVH